MQNRQQTSSVPCAVSTGGEAARAQEPGKDVVVLGSGELAADGAFARLRLVDTRTAGTGVVIATYRSAEPAAGTAA